MLDKIRVHATGKLPADYIPNLGEAKPGMFDGRCCTFLGAPYEEIKQRVLAGETDEAVLAWLEQRGGRRSDDDCLVWNSFMMKRGWHDPAENVQTLATRIKESGLEGKGIQTFFDYIDCDEGRDPFTGKSWEKV
jgi:gluconokinase